MDNTNQFNRRFKKKKSFFFLFFLCMIAVVSAVVMWLWNMLIPDITGYKPVSYWQAMGLLVLARLLTGTVRKVSHGPGRFAQMRRQFKDQYMHANPEEREALKLEWRKRCHRK